MLASQTLAGQLPFSPVSFWYLQTNSPMGHGDVPIKHPNSPFFFFPDDDCHKTTLSTDRRPKSGDEEDPYKGAEPSKIPILAPFFCWIEFRPRYIFQINLPSSNGQTHLHTGKCPMSNACMWRETTGHRRCTRWNCRGPANFQLIFLLAIFIYRNNHCVEAISCYDCKSEDSSCNVGECIGSTCLKMVTSNIDNERKTVSKGCSNEYGDNQCKETYLGPKVVLRCTCDNNFCNGDQNLAAAGLQAMPDGSPRIYSPNARLISSLIPLFFLSLVIVIFL